jgi:2-oxoglutarate ferredoxin oxidoreductase subunit alpha
VSKQVVSVNRVVIRFAGDSGDGMQLTGDRFTSETAGLGNDLSTLPDFPAEIRAPAGTIGGVSAFQLAFADHDITTPGDAPNVLVAMNPAALKANIKDLPRGADIILNTDEFTKRNLEKVGYASNPVEDGSLDPFNVHAIALTSQTVEALKGFDLTKKEAERSKNMYALGLLCWLYSRPAEGTRAFLERKFAKKPEILAANLAAFEAGWSFGETTEAFSVQYEVAPASLPAGTYRNITGNPALAYGLIAASKRSGLPLFLGSYPITPASDILHELAKNHKFGVTTFQAEDEIAGIGSAIGAAYGGALAVTTTSGPGIALKSESIGLAVSLELPLIIVDGPADQDGAVRPAAGDVRPQWRVARAGRRAAVAVRLLLRRHGGRPHRGGVPHARVPALRRLHRERLRAVAGAVRGRPADHRPELRDRAEPRHGRRHRGVLAVPARRGDPRPPVGDPGHQGPGAPHRRPGEGRRHRQHLL